MSYVKQTWTDAPSTSSPINATRLNHMEEGIYQASLVAGKVDYSTTEQDTGLKWTDNKSVYQKTVHLDENINGATILQGVDTLINAFGQCTLTISNAQGYTVPFYNSSSYHLQFNKRDEAVGSMLAGDVIVECAGVATVDVTFLYTKQSSS